jgi:hypothetical protein
MAKYAESSFREAIRPKVPGSHNVCCNLMTFLPDPVAEVLRESHQGG